MVEASLLAHKGARWPCLNPIRYRSANNLLAQLQKLKKNFVDTMAISPYPPRVLREIAILASAIGLSQPSMLQSVREDYAKVLWREAADPLAVVALVHHESRWRSSAVSRDGEDIGLGQIRARFEPECRTDADPVRKPSPACNDAKQRLFSGTYNLKRTIGALNQWKSLCKARTGKTPRLEHLLAGYGGMSDPERRIWCGLQKVRGQWRHLPIHKEIQEILRYNKFLQRKFRLFGGVGATTARLPRRK